MGRPVGSKNKNGYRMSLAAWNQRVLAGLKDGSHSRVFNEIVKREVDDPVWGEEFKRLKLEYWKRSASSPLLALNDAASELFAYIELWRLKHPDALLSKEVVQATKILADVLKELARASVVSADKRFEFLQGKDLDDLSFDLPDKEGVREHGGSGKIINLKIKKEDKKEVFENGKKTNKKEK